jgi:hypothetical protein
MWFLVMNYQRFNDIKSRKDRKTSNTNKAIWMRATLAHNQIMDCDALKTPPTKKTEGSRCDYRGD